MKKKICLFCGKSHRGARPALCEAKGEVMHQWTRSVAIRDFWRVLHAIETGELDLEGEARRLIAAKKKKFARRAI